MSRMSEEMVQAIVESSVMYEDCDPREYSGRGMYGAKCFGIDGSPDQIWDLLMEVAADLGEPVPSPSRDSMGLGVIWYWQGTDAPENLPAECEVCERNGSVCEDCGCCNWSKDYACCDCDEEEEPTDTAAQKVAISRALLGDDPPPGIGITTSHWTVRYGTTKCNVCDDSLATEYATGAYGIPCCDACLMVAEGTA